MESQSEGLIGAHVAHLRYLNRRPSSIDQRERTMRRLVVVAELPLLEVPPDILAKFAAWPTHGPDARCATVSHLRGFYGWAVKEDLIEIDPTRKLERPHRPRRLPRPMPDDNVTIALREAGDPIRQWLHLATYAGLRACEIAQVSGEDFRVHGDEPWLVVRESKGGDETWVPIGRPLLPVALELAACRGWCFPKGAGDPSGRKWAGHVTPNQVQGRANDFLHDVGITETLHQLRHWFGTNVYRATGRDLRATQELMRHRSIASTVGYTFVDVDEHRAALDRLPSAA